MIVRKGFDPSRFPVDCLLAGRGRAVSPGKSVRWIHSGANTSKGSFGTPCLCWLGMADLNPRVAAGPEVRRGGSASALPERKKRERLPATGSNPSA